MADSMKLVITCKCEDGKEHNFGWKHAQEMPELTDVKALAQALVTNGSIFENVPTEATSAKVVVTSENDIDISD